MSRVPIAARAVVERPGAPVFIVGCPRSGTTLLRLMLDQHPRLAIPDESHFITELWRPGRRDPPGETLERILGHHRFLRWGVDPAVIRRRFAAVQPVSYPDLIDIVFSAYAEANGKVRWGDKSPPYVARIPLLADLFPTAQFVHLIRDGREVARSLAEHEWGQATPVAAATFWRRQVARGRRAGMRLGAGRYREVRYEQLVEQPEAVLRSVCEFLGESYTRALLEYPASARERVWVGSPADPEHVDHRHLSSAPSPRRRDWRAGLTSSEQRAVDAAAQPLLRRLGYSDEPRRLGSILRVEADQLRRVPRSGWQALRAVLAARRR